MVSLCNPIQVFNLFFFFPPPLRTSFTDAFGPLTGRPAQSRAVGFLPPAVYFGTRPVFHHRSTAKQYFSTEIQQNRILPGHSKPTGVPMGAGPEGGGGPPQARTSPAGPRSPPSPPLLTPRRIMPKVMAIIQMSRERWKWQLPSRSRSAPVAAVILPLLCGPGSAAAAKAAAGGAEPVTRRGGRAGGACGALEGGRRLQRPVTSFRWARGGPPLPAAVCGRGEARAGLRWRHPRLVWPGMAPRARSGGTRAQRRQREGKQGVGATPEGWQRLPGRGAQAGCGV